MKIRQGTRLPPYKGQVIQPEPTPGAAPALLDLTQFTTITFRMVSGSTVVTGNTVVSDAQGNIQYNWGVSDTAVPGIYSAYFIGTDASGKTETFPSDQNITIEVIPTV